MTNSTTELERVLELVEKATPGPWRVSGTSHLCDAKRHIIHPQGEDGEAIAAAVNFLREHGRTLLEALRDAERLDWLAAKHASEGPSWNVREPSNEVAIPNLRAAIDAARKQEPQE